LQYRIHSKFPLCGNEEKNCTKNPEQERKYLPHFFHQPAGGKQQNKSTFNENYVYFISFHWIPSTGIHVLRILKYDRQSLGLRRLQSENVDADPIVWTNQRFIRWARSIDLGEYAENLKGEQMAF
jgi:hypothetical protein